MKKVTFMSALCALAITSLCATAAMAETYKVTGSMDINYQSRVQADDAGVPPVGVEDTYKLDLSVTDSLAFGGTIKALPTVIGGVLKTEKQAAQVSYDIGLSVRNPANPAQTKAIGKFVGAVPVDRKGVYHYDQGTLRIAVDSAGSAAGFASTFRGTAVGRAPKGAETLVESVKKQAVTVSRQVQGRTVKIIVSDFDKMNYNGLVLAAGPVKVYPEATVNGEMLYDYERDAWYFNGVTMNYQVDGKEVVDKLSGNIKWVESPQRASNGEGEYQFDVRVNEPTEAKAGTEAAVFDAAADESAFFFVDTRMPSMTGSAKYKDAIAGETVKASKVSIDLAGNNLTKQQVVNLTKLIWLVNVVPMNAE